MASRSTTKVQYACGCPRSRCFNPGITLCRSGIWTSRITSIDSDPDLPSHETVGACGVDTRNPPRRHVCSQLSRHDIQVATIFEKKKKKTSGSVILGGGVISVVDWSEDASTGGMPESASFGESCRSKLWSSREPRASWGLRQRSGAGKFGYHTITRSHVFEPFVILV